MAGVTFDSNKIAFAILREPGRYGDAQVQGLAPNHGVDTNFFGFVSTAPITGLTLKTARRTAGASG